MTVFLDRVAWTALDMLQAAKLITDLKPHLPKKMHGRADVLVLKLFEAAQIQLDTMRPTPPTAD
jgi:hypothetical protein